MLLFAVEEDGPGHGNVEFAHASLGQGDEHDLCRELDEARVIEHIPDGANVAGTRFGGDGGVGFAALLVCLRFGDAIDHEGDAGHDHLSQFVVVLEGLDESGRADGHFIGDRLAGRVDGVDGPHGDHAVHQSASVVAQLAGDVSGTDLVDGEDAGDAAHVSVDEGIELALFQRVEQELQAGGAAQHLAGGVVVVDFAERGAEVRRLQHREAGLQHSAELRGAPLLFLAREETGALGALVDEPQNGHQLFFDQRQQRHLAVGHGSQEHPEHNAVGGRQAARAARAFEDVGHLLVKVGRVGAETLVQHLAPMLDDPPQLRHRFCLAQRREGASNVFQRSVDGFSGRLQLDHLLCWLWRQDFVW